MTAKHTPTPFKIRTKKRIFDDGEKYIEIEGADLKIVLLSGIWGMPEAETNAKFIVTACNAYEANERKIKVLAEALKETRNALLFLAQETEARAGAPKAIIGGAMYHAEKAKEALKLAGEDV